VKERFVQLGIEPVGSSAAESRAFLATKSRNGRR
jgi:hypothetical protein